MAVTLPTVDDFTETTVLTMIRKVVDYLCSDSGLVAQINDNDITGFTSSYTNNLLKIDATKGDGTKIPVCSLTIEGGSSTGNPYPTGITGTVGADGNITFTVTMSNGSPLTTTINMNYFASAEDLSDLQEQVSGIKPVVTVNDNVSPPTITVSVNGTNSTTNLPSVSSGYTEYTKSITVANFMDKIRNLITEGKLNLFSTISFQVDDNGPTGIFIGRLKRMPVDVTQTIEFIGAGVVWNNGIVAINGMQFNPTSFSLLYLSSAYVSKQLTIKKNVQFLSIVTP